MKIQNNINKSFYSNGKAFFYYKQKDLYHIYITVNNDNDKISFKVNETKSNLIVNKKFHRCLEPYTLYIDNNDFLSILTGINLSSWNNYIKQYQKYYFNTSLLEKDISKFKKFNINIGQTFLSVDKNLKVTTIIISNILYSNKKMSEVIYFNNGLRKQQDYSNFIFFLATKNFKYQEMDFNLIKNDLNHLYSFKLEGF